MRDFSALVMSHLGAREGLHARLMIWIEAKDRVTGDPVTIGFWNGDDHQEFTIDGETRLYYGAGAFISLPSFVANIGLKVRTTRLKLSPIAPEVKQAILGTDVRFAPAEIHIAFHNPQSHNLIDAPERVFSGWVDQAPITTPKVGGDATCELSLVNSARALTKTLALKKSDESLKLRTPTDEFRKFTDISGAVEGVWGELRATAPAPTAAPSYDPIADLNRGP